jgi:hypothetical protein
MPNDSNLDQEPVPFLRQDAVESARGDVAAAPRSFFQSLDSLEEYPLSPQGSINIMIKMGVYSHKLRQSV